MDAQVTEHFERRMERLGEIELYHDGEDWVESESVWKRPLRPQAFPYTTFDSVTQSTLFNYSSLTMNRTLTALYEQDFLYPPAASDNIAEYLKTAYSPPLRTLANELIAPLEEKVLGVLQRQVKVGGGVEQGPVQMLSRREAGTPWRSRTGFFEPDSERQ